MIVRKWLQRLEELVLLHPSSVEPDQRTKYQIKMFLIIILNVLTYFYFAVGAIYPDIGLLVGTHVSAFGFGGQLYSAGAIPAETYCLLLRLASWQLNYETRFIKNLLAYDDKKSRKILKGSLRKKLLKNLGFLSIINSISQIQFALFVVLTVIITVVTLEMINVTLSMVVAFCFSTPMIIMFVYFFLDSQVYTLAFWFMCKRHLDLQTDALLRSFDRHLQGQLPDTSYLTSIEKRYHDLLGQIKEFNKYSQNLISPYRLLATISSGVLFYGAQNFSNQYASIAGSCAVICVYITSLAFLSTCSSLSIRRKKLYLLSNSLYIKYIMDRKTWKERMVLRRIIKSLGNNQRPTIGLIDRSGEEMNAMEYVEFVAECFSVYFQTVRTFRV